MSAIDVPELEVPASAEPAPLIERPIFVAEGPQRRRIVRAAAITMAVLAVAWLGALVAGGFGLGRLGGIPTLGLGGAAQPKAPAASRATSERAVPHVGVTASASDRAVHGAAAGRSAPARPAARAPVRDARLGGVATGATGVQITSGRTTSSRIPSAGSRARSTGSSPSPVTAFRPAPARTVSRAAPPRAVSRAAPPRAVSRATRAPQVAATRRAGAGRGTPAAPAASSHRDAAPGRARGRGRSR
jgi:hypothetical protein